MRNSKKNFILSEIQSLQKGVLDNALYPKGVFPSYRFGLNQKKQVEDNNIFFNTLISYTLKDLRELLDENAKMIVDDIIQSSTQSFQYYKNRKQGITYNFYPIYPEEKPFPNLILFRNSERRFLPDDLDVTSIIYNVLDESLTTNKAVKKEMIIHSQKDLYVSTFKQYRESQVYKTWFADKMKQDIDICVLCNVLLFMFEKKLPLESIDIHSMELITSAIRQNLHLKSPLFLSPHYQNSAIILYHVSRLMAKANHPILNTIKRKVILDIRNELLSVSNAMEKVTLLIALYRLGEKEDFRLNFQQLQQDMKEFYWFRAYVLSHQKFWVRKIVGRSKWLNLLYQCDAHSWSLILELQCLSQVDLYTSHFPKTS